ncbi:MAG TPA: bile acid:sodium symporter family protein [Steroidobacteraceae bacterium]|nr:bile acid:sodium symporter family protein [Steroidobacteraceae bacterium]
MSDVVQTLLPAALAIIMFAVGITLVPADFSRLAARPRAIVAGLIGQVVVLPAAAYGLALACRLSPVMAAGLMIVAACPGGASSALIAHLARGSAALSVTLTAITSIAALVTMPLVVQAGVRLFMGQEAPAEFSVGGIVRGVFVIATVPVALGVALRSWQPALIARIERPLGKVATALFVAIVVATFVAQREPLLANMSTVGPAAAILNVTMMAAGVALGRAFGVNRRDGIAIAADCGLHNAALGIFVATTVFQAPALAVPSVVYALLMNVGAFALIAFGRRYTALESRPCARGATTSSSSA